MISAPSLAAMRTNASAVTMFCSRSFVIANCVVATVTSRGGRTAGSARRLSRGGGASLIPEPMPSMRTKPTRQLNQERLVRLSVSTRARNNSIPQWTSRRRAQNKPNRSVCAESTKEMSLTPSSFYTVFTTIFFLFDRRAHARTTHRRKSYPAYVV